MQVSKNISELLGNADSLESAVIALARAYPDMTTGTLVAVETAELVDLGWGPTAAHRDVTYLMAMVAMLRPVCERKGDVPLTEAFRMLADSGQHEAMEIAAALDVLTESRDVSR